MKKQIKLVSILSVGLFLVACSSTKQSIAIHKPKINNNWQLVGRIAMVYPKPNCRQSSGCTRSDQGRINWQQQQQNYSIRLRDPFGRVVIKIDGDNNQLTAVSPNQAPNHTTPKQFIALLAKQSGNHSAADISPIDLSYWVTGRPNPNTAVSEQKAEYFVQQGYKVNAKQWRLTGVGKVPSLVTIKKEGLTLRLIIQDWQGL